MKFWNVTVFSSKLNCDITFLLQGPKYKKAKIVSILSEVHPEYSKFRVKTIKRPPGIKAWGEE
jgi:hypothetical protein